MNACVVQCMAPLMTPMCICLLCLWGYWAWCMYVLPTPAWCPLVLASVVPPGIHGAGLDLLREVFSPVLASQPPCRVRYSTSWTWLTTIAVLLDLSGFFYFWRAFTDAQLDLPKAQMFSVLNLCVSVGNSVWQAYLVLKGFLYNSDLFILLILPFSVHSAYTRSCQANNGTQKNLFYFKTFLKY